jgi:hypothetical protein
MSTGNTLTLAAEASHISRLVSGFRFTKKVKPVFI